MADKSVSRSDFIVKLHRLLTDPTHAEDLHWDDDECFRITCEDGRAREALSSAWTFTSLSTFVRQLNYYGFERQSDRRRTAERSGRSRHAGYILFKHPSGNFNRYSPELADRIQRRARKRAPPGTPGVPRANRLGRPIKEPSAKAARAAAAKAAAKSLATKGGISIKTEDLPTQSAEPSVSSSSSLSPVSPISPIYPITPSEDASAFSSYPESPRFQSSSAFFAASPVSSWSSGQDSRRPSLAMHDGRQLLLPPAATALDSGYFEDQTSHYHSPAESSSGLSPVATPKYSPHSYHESALPPPSYPYSHHTHPSMLYTGLSSFGRPSLSHGGSSTPRESYLAGLSHHPTPALTGFSSWAASHDPRLSYRVKEEATLGYHRA